MDFITNFSIKLSNNKSNSVSSAKLLAYSKLRKVVFYCLFISFHFIIIVYFGFVLNFLHLNKSGVNVYALNRSRSRSSRQSNYNHFQFCKKQKRIRSRSQLFFKIGNHTPCRKQNIKTKSRVED